MNELNFNTLFNTSISGGLLVFFVVKLVPALYDIARAVDRNTRGLMLAVIAFGSGVTGEVEKTQAREIKKETEEAEESRPKRNKT